MPVRHMGGGLVRSNQYTIADQLASNIFTGDLVKSTGTGRNVDVCAAGNRTIGVFNGCEYLNAQGDVIYSPYWPTGTATKGAAGAKAHVFDDPQIAFEAQVSGAAGLVAADVGTFADITTATAGSATTGKSGMEVDQATITATTATGGQVKIIGLVDRPDNDYGQYAKALVLINEHEWLAGMTAGAGRQAV
jgi:hypothetical protein